MSVYIKKGIYYYSQWIPTKLHEYFTKKRYVHCLHTRNQQKADGLATKYKKRYEDEFLNLYAKTFCIKDYIIESKVKPNKRSLSDKTVTIKKKVNPNIKTKQKKRLYVKRLKGELGCACCGFKENTDVLHFHHIDPTTKIANVSRMVSKNHSLDRILLEIQKCRLLCITCHHKEHGIKDNYV